MADTVLNTVKMGQDGRTVHPTLMNTAKDGSGTWYVPIVDSDGKIVISQLGTLARSLAVILGTRWDASGDLGTDIAQLLTYCDILDDGTNGLAAIKTAIAAITSTDPKLAYLGTVSAITDATHVVCADLLGYGETYFKNWSMLKVWAFDGLGAAPQGETRKVTGYVTATGAITHLGYSATPYRMPSDDVLLSHDTEETLAPGGYQLVPNETLTITVAGTYRVKFDLKANAVGQTAYARIYKNNAAIGTIRTANAADPPVYETFSQDFTNFVAGDVIEIWAQSSSGWGVKVRNFRIYGASISPFAIGDKVLMTPPGLLSPSLNAEVAISGNAVTTPGLTVLSLIATGAHYLVENLILKAADPGANTINVNLYQLVNGASTLVKTFAITTANYTVYYNLESLFGLSCLAGDSLIITAVTTAGTYAMTGSNAYRSI